MGQLINRIWDISNKRVLDDIDHMVRKAVDARDFRKVYRFLAMLQCQESGFAELMKSERSVLYDRYERKHGMYSRQMLSEKPQPEGLYSKMVSPK